MSDRATSSVSRPTPGGTFTLTGRTTPRIGYGMGQITRHAETPEARTRAIRLLRRAYELGITHYDTAQFYGNGLGNELLRESLSQFRDDLVIATKAGAKPVPDAKIP